MVGIKRISELRQQLHLSVAMNNESWHLTIAQDTVSDI